jgi:hypothetical protein
MEGPGSGGKPPVKLSFDDGSWQRIVELDQRPRYVVMFLSDSAGAKDAHACA